VHVSFRAPPALVDTVEKGLAVVGSIGKL